MKKWIAVGVFTCVLLASCNLGLNYAEGAAGKNAKYKDIKKLLVLTGASKVGIQVMTQMVNSFKVGLPDVPGEFWDRFLKKVNPEELDEMIVPIYDKYFTHEDIKESIKFYQTPLGKKWVATMPAITQEAYVVGERWGRELATKVIEELEKEGYKTR